MRARAGRARSGGRAAGPAPGAAPLAALACGLAAGALLFAASPDAGMPPLPRPDPSSVCRVAILEPMGTRVLYGLVDLYAEVVCPAGAQAASVRFVVDGRIVAEVTRPPFGATWDAGAGFAPHLVEARLTDRQGRPAVDLVWTPGPALQESLRVISTPIDRVEMSVSVTDPDGRHVHGLTAADFIVEEEGRRQSIGECRPEDRPLSLAILIDASSSLAARWPLLRDAVPHLARTLRARDAAKVIAFNGPAYLVQDFTRDAGAVSASLDQFRHWGGGTSLYDTLAATGTELAWGRGGRQAVVLLTDGIDTLSRIDPSRLRNYLRRTDVTVQTFLVRAPKTAGFPNARRFARTMEQLSRDTGGLLQEIDAGDPGSLSRAFAGVGEDLQDRYYLAYHSDLAGRKEGWRGIEVRARRADLTVRTRREVIGSRDVSAYLVEDLERGDAAARRKAAEWLGTMAVPNAGEPLLRALSDRSAEVRVAAAVALGRVREPRAIEPLLLLLFERDEGLGQAAAEALRTLGPVAVPAVIGALEARETIDEEVEEGMVRALAVLADVGDARALGAIVRLAMPPPPATAASVRDDRSSIRDRRAAARVRAWAIFTLGRMRHPDGFSALAKAASDRSPEVRVAGLRALGASGLERAIAVLARAAGEDESPETRREALDAMALALGDLAGEGRLAGWARRPENAPAAIEAIRRAADAGPAGDGALRAFGGPDRAAELLDAIASRLPPEPSRQAAELALRLRSGGARPADPE